jgi:hypothetical protein
MTSSQNPDVATFDAPTLDAPTFNDTLMTP